MCSNITHKKRTDLKNKGKTEIRDIIDKRVTKRNQN